MGEPHINQAMNSICKRNNKSRLTTATLAARLGNRVQLPERLCAGVDVPPAEERRQRVQPAGLDRLRALDQAVGGDKGSSGDRRVVVTQHAIVEERELLWGDGGKKREREVQRSGYHHRPLTNSPPLVRPLETLRVVGIQILYTRSPCGSLPPLPPAVSSVPDLVCRLHAAGRALPS